MNIRGSSKWVRSLPVLCTCSITVIRDLAKVESRVQLPSGALNQNGQGALTDAGRLNDVTEWW